MKCKASILVLLALVFTTAITPAVPVKAINMWANGTIDSYVDAWSSEIVWGRWYVEVVGDTVNYEAVYLERNLDSDIEQSPEGSIDVFIHEFSVEGFAVVGGRLEFWGTLHVKKWWAKLDGTREWVEWDTSPVTITMTSRRFYLDSPPPGPEPDPLEQDWDRVGRTLSVHISP
jgi:hypothetical protein